MIDVKFKKLTKDVKLPTKATEGSAAYDLYTPDYCIIPRGRSVIKLNFSMAMPYGIQAQIEPRSGYSCKGFEAYIYPRICDKILPVKKEDFANYLKINKPNTARFDADVIVGKVDADFRGCVGVLINNRSNFNFFLDKHQRIAQMTFQKVEDVKFEEVIELDETERGDGGYGHSGSGEIK